MGRDYVVVYEEPFTDDPAADELVLDVDVHAARRGAMRVEADFGAAVTNEASPLAVFGLVLTFLGALVGFATAWFFWVYYPESFPGGTDAEGSNAPKIMAALTIAMGVLLVAGTLFVGFGRSLRARGILHSLRFR
jgi:hypothetical protein